MRQRARGLLSSLAHAREDAATQRDGRLGGDDDEKNARERGAEGHEDSHGPIGGEHRRHEHHAEQHRADDHHERGDRDLEATTTVREAARVTFCYLNMFRF